MPHRLTVKSLIAVWLMGVMLLTVTAGVHSQGPTPQKIESDDAVVSREGLWESQNASGASGGSYLYNANSQADASLTVTFSGTSLEVIYASGPGLGTLAIEIDGTVLRTVITTADKTNYGQVAKINYLSDENHTLKVYAQAGGVVGVDAFVVTSTNPVPVNGEGNAEGVARDGLGSGDWTATYMQAFPPTATCTIPALTDNPVPGGSTLAGTAQVPEIDFDWGTSTGPSQVGPDTDLFGIIFRRTVNFPQDVTVRIDYTVDDAIRMYDDGVRFVNRWGCNSATPISIFQTFTAGSHDLEIQYAEITGSARIQVVFTMIPSLQVTTLSDSQIQLVWTDLQTDETEYRIERSPDGTSNWVEIGTAPANTTTYTNVSLICNTSYFYRVRAYRASDMTYSAYSSVANATTAACPTSCHPNDVVQLVSRASDGTFANTTSSISSGNSPASALSDNGRYVAFSSQATSLVPNDTNNLSDIFLVDRQTCQVWRISLASNSTQSNADSYGASMSGDGRYIGFASTATNLLIVSDPYSYNDVFIHDRQTGQTRLVSGLGNDTAPIFANNDSTQLRIALSDDGRLVTFTSKADNLVIGDTNTNPLYNDVFVKDMQTGAITRVSLHADGIQSQYTFVYPDISGDGRYVVFHGDDALVPNDIYPGADVYLYDRQTGQPYLVSVATGGVHNTNSGGSYNAAISDDGRYIVFWSYSTFLVANDTNSQPDIFLHDRLLNQTIRVSQSVNGVGGNDDSLFPSISDDGRFVAFYSCATNLGPIVTAGFCHTYLWDRLTHEISLVSRSADGIVGNSSDGLSSVSGDGHFVAFQSSSTNLVPNDINGMSDIFVTDVGKALAKPDTLSLFNTTMQTANLVRTLSNPPVASDYVYYATSFPYGTGGQYVMGDWNGDGLDTMGVYRNGAFWYTNDYGQTGNWTGIWFGLGGQAIAGRFDGAVGHDCIGVTDSGTWTSGDTFFALYFTCNLTSGPTPTLTYQWLSIVLPTSAGHSGTFQFSAGDLDGDGVDSIAIRRGNYIAWTNIPPTTLLSEFSLAQYFGAPGTGDEGKFVVGDWDLNNVDSFGLVYQNGRFYRRDDLTWNSGAYTLQQFTPLVGTPFGVTTWRPN